MQAYELPPPSPLYLLTDGGWNGSSEQQCRLWKQLSQFFSMSAAHSNAAKNCSCKRGLFLKNRNAEITQGRHKIGEIWYCTSILTGTHLLTLWCQKTTAADTQCDANKPNDVGEGHSN